MNLLTSDSVPYILASLFLEEVHRGHIWVPRCVTDDGADVIVTVLRSRSQLDLTIHVDTDNGYASIWEVARSLTDRAGSSTAVIGSVAKSAGLIVSVACDRRICQPNTEFLYHGSPFKSGADDDRQKAKWFTSRTSMPEDFWLEMAMGGEDHIFGADDAMAWGVVHEISK